MQCANFIKLEREQRGLGHAAGAKSLEESCPRAESYPRAALDVGPILGQDLCTCVFPALIMRMVLRQLRKLVEVDVNDLDDRWRDAVSATTTSSCGASLTIAAILQFRSSCARTTSPGKFGSSTFVVVEPCLPFRVPW